jgi:hypothetical protein
MNRPANKRPALDAAIVFSLYFRRHSGRTFGHARAMNTVTTHRVISCGIQTFGLVLCIALTVIASRIP